MVTIWPGRDMNELSFLQHVDSVLLLGAAQASLVRVLIEQYGRLLRDARRLHDFCRIYAMRFKRRLMDTMRWRQGRVLTSSSDLLFLFNILKK